MSPVYIVVESIVDVAFSLQHKEAGHFQQTSFFILLSGQVVPVSCGVDVAW